MQIYVLATVLCKERENAGKSRAHALISRRVEIDKEGETTIECIVECMTRSSPCNVHYSTAV